MEQGHAYIQEATLMRQLLPMQQWACCSHAGPSRMYGVAAAGAAAAVAVHATHMSRMHDPCCCLNGCMTACMRRMQVLPSLREHRDEVLLRELYQRWCNHKLMVRWLSRFFNYLDR